MMIIFKLQFLLVWVNHQINHPHSHFIRLYFFSLFPNSASFLGSIWHHVFFENRSAFWQSNVYLTVEIVPPNTLIICHPVCFPVYQTFKKLIYTDACNILDSECVSFCMLVCCWRCVCCLYMYIVFIWPCCCSSLFHPCLFLRFVVHPHMSSRPLPSSNTVYHS